MQMSMADLEDLKHAIEKLKASKQGDQSLTAEECEILLCVAEFWLAFGGYLLKDLAKMVSHDLRLLEKHKPN